MATHYIVRVGYSETPGRSHAAPLECSCGKRMVAGEWEEHRRSVGASIKSLSNTIGARLKPVGFGQGKSRPGPRPRITPRELEVEQAVKRFSTMAAAARFLGLRPANVVKTLERLAAKRRQGLE